MRHSKKSKRISSTQTFDSEDFDIHATEHSFRSKILPNKRGEPLLKLKKDVRWLQGTEKNEPRKQKRSFLISIFSNILIPGLGNSYIHASAFSVSILALSLLVIFTTFSPVFPVVQIFNLTQFAQPSAGQVAEVALFVPANVVVNNQVTLVGPTFSVLVVPLLLAWIHLIYLFIHRDHKIEWTL